MTPSSARIEAIVSVDEPDGTSTEATSSPGSPDGSTCREAQTITPPIRIATTSSAAPATAASLRPLPELGGGNSTYSSSARGRGRGRAA